MKKALAAAVSCVLLSTVSSLAVEKIPLQTEMRIHVTRDQLQVVKFPYKVLEAFVDASKGIQVQGQGNQLIIKWNPYVKKPAVISVTLIDNKGNTHDYSLIAFPDRRIPEVVEVYLPQKVKEKERLKMAARFEQGMPYEDLLVALTKAFMCNSYPDYYAVKKMNKRIAVFKEIEVYLTEVGSGDKFKVLKGYVRNRLKNPIYIDETALSFLARKFDVRSISLRKHNLEPGETSTFVVVVAAEDN